MIGWVASAPADVKLRCAQLLRFATALRVTSSSAAAACSYAESRAFGVCDTATITKPRQTVALTPNYQPVHESGAASHVRPVGLFRPSKLDASSLLRLG